MCETVAEPPVTIENIAVKTCSKCHVAKKLVEFNRDPRNTDGFVGFCKECESRANKVRREKSTAREIVIVPDFKICPRCDLEKASIDFSKRKVNSDGLGAYCKECEANIKRKRRYGLSYDQFCSILRSQDGSCAICGFKPEDGKLDVDHIHGTKTVRGLLHRNCNVGLGHFKDSINFISKAIDYVSGPDLGIPYKKTWGRYGVAKSLKGRTLMEGILEQQNYLCKICSIGLHRKNARLDHDYRTNMVRGALCICCNIGLGQFKDSVELLSKAIDYLTPFLRGNESVVVF
jgi:hypothetical protein